MVAAATVRKDMPSAFPSEESKRFGRSETPRQSVFNLDHLTADITIQGSNVERSKNRNGSPSWAVVRANLLQKPQQTRSTHTGGCRAERCEQRTARRYDLCCCWLVCVIRGAIAQP
jgi:hypothetical protein